MKRFYGATIRGIPVCSGGPDLYYVLTLRDAAGKEYRLRFGTEAEAESAGKSYLGWR